jgi:hypothetical protein
MKTIVGLYDELYDAQDVIDDLIGAGVSRDHISLIVADPDRLYAGRLPEYQADVRDIAQEDVGDKATTGALVGGVAGTLLTLGAFVIPGLSPLIALGPVVGGIVGAGVGAAVGGIMATLTKWGIPEEEAGAYAEAVRRGMTLVAVTVPDDQVDTTLEVMDEYDPVNLEQRLAYWHGEGWGGYDPQAELYSTAQIEEERERYAIYETYEPIFQQHYDEHYVNSGYPYSRYTPAYHAGYILGSDMRFKDLAWEEVEAEARGRWQTEHALVGPWEDFKEAIRYAWAEVKEDYYGEDDEDDGQEDDDYDYFAPLFQRHYQDYYADSGLAYERYEPAYHSGYNLATDIRFRNLEWNELEPEARLRWEVEHPQHESWSSVRAAVQQAWQDVREAIDWDDEYEREEST